MGCGTEMAGASSPKMKRLASEVRPAADALRDFLAPACARIEVAGSLRRGKAEVGDIEIVALPAPDTDLFGEPLAATSALDMRLITLVSCGAMAWDAGLRRNGPRYKRFVVPSMGGMGLDLFLASEDNWGNILAIRTGPQEFARLLVTKRAAGGWMPDHLRQEGGYLLASSGGQLPCPTEEDFFAALGLAWMPPEARGHGTPVRVNGGAE